MHMQAPFHSPTGEFWLASLKCKLEPQDGTLVMLLMSVVQHGTAPCELPDGAEQNGTALFANRSTSRAIQRNLLASMAQSKELRFCQRIGNQPNASDGQQQGDDISRKRLRD